MLGVVKALVKNKYAGSIYPEHTLAFEAGRDRRLPEGGPIIAAEGIRDHIEGPVPIPAW